MSDIEYHKTLNDLLKPINTVVIDAAYLEIPFTKEVENEFTKIGIETEKIQERLRLLTNSIQTKIFKSIDDFLNVREINDNSNLFIIDDTKIISFIGNETFQNFKSSPNYFLVTNTRAYLEFQNFLKKQESETDEAFHFVDSYNKDSRKISFVSLSEKGRLNISYEIKAPLFDTSKDYRKGLHKFKICFDNENKSLAKFLKSATISVASNFPSESRLKNLFESLENVTEKARINFEVYLNNLSIDGIKKGYDEVKSKYFNSLSEILSGLTQKIIALPIGITAALFTVNTVKDVSFFLYFIIAATLVTSTYISILLRVHFKDLRYLSKIFHYDYGLLMENNFFTKYPEEKILFQEIKTRITDRIKFLRILIESYYWIMNLANLVIIGFILYSLGQKGVSIILFSTVFLVILASLRNYILEKDEGERTIDE
jgi:hypothetical protein